MGECPGAGPIAKAEAGLAARNTLAELDGHWSQTFGPFSVLFASQRAVNLLWMTPATPVTGAGPGGAMPCERLSDDIPRRASV